MKKAQQRLFLKQAGLSSRLLINFYGSAIENILCYCVTVWYSSRTAQDRKDSARVVKTAKRIVGDPLPDLDSVYAERLQKKVRNIAADPTHPGHGLFDPLPSGHKSTHTQTEHSFSPRAVTSITPFTLTPSS